jgi:general secretion pathway protein G
MSRKAFTLVELVMVIVIIGLLAAVVVPKFGDMKTEAQNAAEKATVAGIRSGIKLAHMTSLAKGTDAYPATLDSAANGAASEAKPLFTEVIEDGISDPNWEKLGSGSYRYIPTGIQYTYDQSTGKFNVKG